MKNHLRNRMIYTGHGQKLSFFEHERSKGRRNKELLSLRIFDSLFICPFVLRSLAMLFIFGTSVLAQSVSLSTITGRITDARGSVVGGAQVTVASGSQTISTAATASDGRFTID